jgi:hypothetical protein
MSEKDFSGAPSRVLSLSVCLVVLSLAGCKPKTGDAGLSRFEKAVAQICRDSRDAEAASEQADETNAETFDKLGDKEKAAQANRDAVRAAADLKSLNEVPSCKPYLTSGAPVSTSKTSKEIGDDR